MKKTQLYLLALALAALALSAIVYKWQVLQFPLQAESKVEVWTLQARIGYVPEQGANRITLQVPGDAPGWSASAGTFKVDARGNAYVILTTAVKRGQYDQIRLVRREHLANGKVDTYDILAAKL